MTVDSLDSIGLEDKTKNSDRQYWNTTSILEAQNLLSILESPTDLQSL